MKTKTLLLLFIVFQIGLVGCNKQQTNKTSENNNEVFNNTGSQRPLVIVWSNDSKEVAVQTVLDFPLNARLNGWFEDITLMVWGPSVQLLTNDKEIQELVKSLKSTGVKVVANKISVEKYNAQKTMEELDIEIMHLGKSLSGSIRNGDAVISF